MNDARSPQSAETQISRCGAVNRMMPIMAYTHGTCKLHGRSDVETASEEEMKKREERERGGEDNRQCERLPMQVDLKKAISITVIFMIMTGLRPFTCPGVCLHSSN